jgi:hypothetical protein
MSGRGLDRECFRLQEEGSILLEKMKMLFQHAVVEFLLPPVCRSLHKG